MGVSDELLTRICKCLAFHANESEITYRFMTPQDPYFAAHIDEAKALIAEAGLDYDTIYPVAERSTAVEAAIEEN
jgi:hypothetical protein